MVLCIEAPPWDACIVYWSATLSQYVFFYPSYLLVALGKQEMMVQVLLPAMLSTQWSSTFLALACAECDCCSYLGSNAADGRSLLSFLLSSPLFLCSPPPFVFVCFANQEIDIN